MIVFIAAFAVVLGVTAAFAWAQRSLLIATVRGESMEPALHHGDRVLVRRSPAADLRAGQVVLVERPPPEQTTWSWRDGEQVLGSGWRTGGEAPTNGRWLVKRIGGIGGDPVPDVLLPFRTSLGPVIPPGYVAVLGDNADRSHDSRHFGYLPRRFVLGVVIGYSSPPSSPQNRGGPH